MGPRHWLLGSSQRLSGAVVVWFRAQISKDSQVASLAAKLATLQWGLVCDRTTDSCQLNFGVRPFQFVPKEVLRGTWSLLVTSRERTQSP